MTGGVRERHREQFVEKERERREREINGRNITALMSCSVYLSVNASCAALNSHVVVVMT